MRRLFGLWAIDAPLVGAVGLLSLLGLAMIFSAVNTVDPDPAIANVWIRQGVFFGVALVAFTIVSRIPQRWIEWAAMPSYAFGLVLLAATLVIGTGAGTAAGTKSFISLGGFRFQPAEPAKIATILALAQYLSARGESPSNLRDLLVPGLIAGVPLGLVLLQPDLGTAQAFVGILFAALFWAGTPIPILLLLASPLPALILAFDPRVWAVYIVCVGIALYLLRYRLYFYESVAVILANFAAGTIATPLWNSLADYQKSRLLVYLDPQLDPRGWGWNIIQSKVAIGGGGLTGMGYLEGTQKRFNFLPEQHTDFIFSVVGEEFGFVGVVMALLLFGFVLWRLVRLASASSDPFAGLVLLGIFGAWFVHIFVNVGMTIGLVPVTGIPLPFVSYGGTFLMMSWVALAIAVRVAYDDERSPA